MHILISMIHCDVLIRAKNRCQAVVYALDASQMDDVQVSCSSREPK